MACHYHPERESTDICAICGKPICKECGLEIAGKIYCKDCLQKIVGVGIENNAEPVEEPQVENVYNTQEEVIYDSEESITQEYGIADDSPYNIRDNIEYSGGLESSYLYETEEPQQVVQNEVEYVQEPAQTQQVAQEEYYAQEPTQIQQVVENEAEYYAQEPAKTQQVAQEEYIYPDHSFEPQTTSARMDLEDKYEKYLDDLYFDEKEVPLEEQLAKDEEQFGSLTRRPYKPSETPAQEQKRARSETPEEMEARIRAVILKEQGIEPEKGKKDKKIRESNENIHNLNYQEEKESMGAVDILLTIVLVIVILIVIYYLVYLFVLHSTYPTFMDALYGLKNPQNVINSALSK